jgi:hypothetical protein
LPAASDSSYAVIIRVARSISSAEVAKIWFKIATTLGCMQLAPSKLSESIAVSEAHARELGYEPTMDSDVAVDLRKIINGRKPRDLSASD